MARKHILDWDLYLNSLPINAGNRTRGEARRGYRGGRKRVYPKGTPVTRLVVTLSEELHLFAMGLGRGNVCAGIREALKLAMAATVRTPGTPPAAPPVTVDNDWDDLIGANPDIEHL